MNPEPKTSLPYIPPAGSVTHPIQTTSTDARLTAHHHAYEYLKGKPTVGRTLWLDRTNASQDIMIAIDWGRADSTHTFTTSFNFLGMGTNVAQTAPGQIDAWIAKTLRLRVQSLAMPNQQISLNNTFVSSAPPPDEAEPATRVDISQIGRSAMFVTLFSNYTVTKQGTIPKPPASIAFETPPHAGQPVQLRLTYPNGSTKLLSFTPPDLSPLIA